MAITDEIKLDDYEDEDIFDIVPKLEKSFAIRFEREAFFSVRTFGDFCAVVSDHIQKPQKEDCTSQQAFYKIRQAIHKVQGIDKNTIIPESSLAAIFSNPHRRRQIKKFQRELGFQLNILTYPGWLAKIFFIGVLASCITFFFDWKIALSGLILFVTAIYIADKTGKNIELNTVKELTEKMVSENYNDIRRTPYSVNKNEVAGIIKDIFNKHFDIAKQNLTDDALFSWAK